jgi:diphthamide synthase (EF-2-diphthine--ammonia ligase)
MRIYALATGGKDSVGGLYILLVFGLKVCKHPGYICVQIRRIFRIYKKR